MTVKRNHVQLQSIELDVPSFKIGDKESCHTRAEGLLDQDAPLDAGELRDVGKSDIDGGYNFPLGGVVGDADCLGEAGKDECSNSDQTLQQDGMQGMYQTHFAAFGYL